MRTDNIFDMKNEIKNDDILFLIRKLSKEIRGSFNKRLEECGLTAQQGRILLFINCNYENKKEVHQNDLEKEFGLSKSTVSGLLDRLESKGLIVRISEKRYSKLEPTDKGRAIVNNVHEGRNETINKLLKNFDDNQKDELILLIKKLLNNIKEEDK